MQGIVLETGAGRARRKAHVHMACDDWVITSSVPADAALTSCEVLSRALPGALGCHFLPADAVLHFNDRHATPADLAALVEQERGNARTRTQTLNAQLTAPPVAAPPLGDDPSESESEGEECEFDECSDEEPPLSDDPDALPEDLESDFTGGLLLAEPVAEAQGAE